VNLAGAFVLGWVVTRLPPASYRRPFLGIGVCGALTTFATLQLELLRMLDAPDPARPLALAYAVASLLGGLAAVRLGIASARDPRTRSVA
jgi:fluoride exporter